MATIFEVFRDNKGNIHHDPASAIVADIAEALGRVGDEGGLTQGVARMIFEKREAIEQAFADFDSLKGDQSTVIDVTSHPRLAKRA